MVVARATASLDRGVAQSGSLDAALGQAIQLAGADVDGWSTVLWEIVSYPEGWTPPAAGWTLSPSTGAYQSTATRPQEFALHETAFGKYDINLTVNGALTDTSLRIEVRSKNLRLYGTGFSESTDRSGFRNFARDVNRNWKILEDALNKQVARSESTGDYQTVQAVSATPGWYVSGAFRATATKTIRLRLVGCVSSAALTMRARLFDTSTTPPAPLSATNQMVSIAASLAQTSALSADSISIIKDHVYQYQVEVTGANTTSDFGAVHLLQAVDV